MRKTITFLLVGGCLAMLTVGSAWAGERYGHQARQRERIRQGVHSGELTRVEARTLHREQRHIRHARKLAWADGHLSKPERAAPAQDSKESRKSYLRIETQPVALLEAKSRSRPIEP